MRILHIIPTLDLGGAEKQLCLLAAGLDRGKFETHVCALTRGGPRSRDLEAAKIPLTVIGKRWKIDPAAWLRLKRHIRKLKPDLVHTWLFAGNSYGRTAAFSAGVPRVIAGERCVDLWKSWHELMIDRRLARRTETIVTNSQGVVQFYANKGIPAKKFTVIPNGVELPPLADPAVLAAERTALLNELELPQNSRLIAAVGRLWPQKNLKDAIWGAELLKVVRDDSHFLIIGEGPHRWRLTRFRDQLHLNGRVHFLGQRNDMARILPHLDCFWISSRYEGQSNAVMEAMAHGIPVVATDIAGNRDLVVHEETGYLIPVGDRAGFASHTNVLLDDPALAEKIGQAARSRMQHFSVAAMIEKHERLYAGNGM